MVSVCDLSSKVYNFLAELLHMVFWIVRFCTLGSLLFNWNQQIYTISAYIYRVKHICIIHKKSKNEILKMNTILYTLLATNSTYGHTHFLTSICKVLLRYGHNSDYNTIQESISRLRLRCKTIKSSPLKYEHDRNDFPCIVFEAYIECLHVTTNTERWC